MSASHVTATKQSMRLPGACWPISEHCAAETFHKAVEILVKRPESRLLGGIRIKHSIEVAFKGLNAPDLDVVLIDLHCTKRCRSHSHDGSHGLIVQLHH
jgi:hypothetical protein